MRRRCGSCLCRTCLNTCCDFKNCTGKKKECGHYSGLFQSNIFEQTPKQTGTPRYSWEHYGISKARYRQLTEYIQSGRYASLASQAAHRSCEEFAEYILLSAMKNLSYEGLEKLWAREEIERMPCGRSDFYGWRRYFFSVMDKKMREIGL